MSWAVDQTDSDVPWDTAENRREAVGRSFFMNSMHFFVPIEVSLINYFESGKIREVSKSVYNE